MNHSADASKVLTHGQLKALQDYLDEMYDDSCIRTVIHSPKADILVVVDSSYRIDMIVASLFLNEGIVMTNDIDAVMIHDRGFDEADLPHTYYVDSHDAFMCFDDDYDQELYDEVADDLYYTFLGADDEMRFREDYE